MRAMIIDDSLLRRQEGLVTDGTSITSAPMPTGSGPICPPSISVCPTEAIGSGIGEATDLSPGTTSALFLTKAPATATSTAAISTAAAASSAPAPSGGINTTTLIEILVPVCVLLAVVPTVAYLCYLRRRDRRQKSVEQQMRGRTSAPSAASGALLLQRDSSAASQQERKLPSTVTTGEIDMSSTAAALEKQATSPPKQTDNLFAPAAHGPTRPPRDNTPPAIRQEPSLPPLHFTHDSDDALNISAPPIGSPPRRTIPPTLPTFAPTQPKARAPAPAFASTSLGSQSSHKNKIAPLTNPTGSQSQLKPPSKVSPATVHVGNDNPSWPLPASGLRDSTSTYSSRYSELPRGPFSQPQNKPLPTALSRELSPARGPISAAAFPSPSSASAPPAQLRAQPQVQKPQQQATLRESSIAYGMPPIPPSPGLANSGHVAGDRRSGASRKRDSDAVSEMSYSASMRGRRDTRRDTDAISMVSAMSDHDR